MAVEPLPSEVTHVPTGWASTASGSVQHASLREATASDVRTLCDECPAFVDGGKDAGQKWLRAHKRVAHGGSP